MKKFLFTLSVFILILVSSISVFAEGKPMTHTYLISNDGNYVFEVTVPATSSTTMCKPILALYDSEGALCGLSIYNGIFVTSRTSAKSFKMEITPDKVPQTAELMMWTSDGLPVPVSQYEKVPTTVCNHEFGSLARVEMTNIRSTQYTFEGIFTPSTDASYTPAIKMYDASGNVCGYYEGDIINFSAGKRETKEFTITSTSTPAKVYFILKNGTEIVQYTEVAPYVATKKVGVIMDVDASKGVKLYSADGTYQYYDFADNFILSYGNTRITSKQSAYNYLDTLKLKSHKRKADLDTDGDGKADYWNTYYDWLLFFDETGTNGRYSQIVRASDNPDKAMYNYILDDYRYEYIDYLNNYAKRVVHVSVTPDGKINSMAFPKDSYFASLKSGTSYSEVFYNKPVTTFSDKLVVKNNAKILYLPTKKDATENDFKVFTPSELKDGNSYYVKEFTTSKNEQIILVTYMLSDAEVTSYNTTTIKNINTALNGNGSTAIGIKDHMFSISINTQSPENNDKANSLANTAMAYVAAGLEGALNDANLGYCITKDYIRIKYDTEISAAKAAINELQEMDNKLNTSYYNNLKNELLDTVESKALEFLEDTFIN